MYRKEKIQELLRQEVALILQREFAAPGVLITVMGVKVSHDGLHANIFYSVLPTGARNDVERMFVREIYDIQQMVNKKLRMHPVPKIRFVLDTTEAQASHIDEILRSVHDGKLSVSKKLHVAIKPKKSHRVRKTA